MRAAGKPSKTGRRLDREAYFNAAFKILATRGPQELTLQNLCVELGVTRGSFYHHFADSTTFTTALIESWEFSVGEILAGWAEMDPVEAFDSAMAATNRWPFQAEAALRAWGWSNPAVAAAVKRSDLARENLNREWLGHFIDDPERCRVVAHMAHVLAAGMTVLQRPVDLELVREMQHEFARSILGVDILATPDGDRAVARPTTSDGAM